MLLVHRGHVCYVSCVKKSCVEHVFWPLTIHPDKLHFESEHDLCMQLLWNGQMAFKAALELIEAAEHASQQDAAHQGTEPQQFVWRQDLLRPALDARQVLPA